MLEIRKGGRLFETSWRYSKKARKGSYVTKDVTRTAFRRLFDPCTLAEDVTLRDVFLLLRRELSIYNLVFGNWCREVVTEGLQKGKKIKGGRSEIKCLELYWDWEVDVEKKKTKLELSAFPSFHGLGGKKSMPWSLMFFPANGLASLPLKLRKEFVVHANDRSGKPLVRFDDCQYSLGHILYGVIWELSFCGPPEKRDKEKKALFRILKDEKDGKPQLEEQTR